LVVGKVGELALIMRRLELGSEAFVFRVVELDVGIFEGGLFGTREFAGDEVGNVGEFEFGIEFNQVRVHESGTHKMDSGEENAKDVE
jgi:hypothetical protein